MKMLHDFIAIEPDKPEEKTASGFYVAEQIKTYPPFGTVRHVADNISVIKAGDRVVYKVYASVDINRELAVVPMSAVIAVLEAS